MKPTSIGSALTKSTDVSEKPGKKSSSRKAISADKKESSIKEKTEKIQPEAHRKGEERSKPSRSASSPTSNVAREVLPAGPETHAESKRFSMAEKAGRRHAGKAGRKERSEGSEVSGKDGGMPDKYVKSGDSASAGIVSSRSATQRFGVSKTNAPILASTTSRTTTTSRSSSEEDPPVTYENLSDLMKELGKASGSSHNVAKVDDSGHSRWKEESSRSGSHYRKGSAPQGKIGLSTTLSSNLEEPAHKKEPTYEKVLYGEMQTRSKSKNLPQRSRQAESPHRGRQPEIFPPQKKNASQEQPTVRQFSQFSSEKKSTDILAVPDPYKRATSGVSRGLGTEFIAMNAPHDPQYESTKLAMINPASTRPVISAGKLRVPLLALDKVLATSLAKYPHPPGTRYDSTDDSSYSDSDSCSQYSPLEPSHAMAKSLVEEKYAAEKAVAQSKKQTEWPSMSGTVSPLGKSNMKDGVSADSGSDDNTFMTPDLRAKGYRPTIGFQPNPYGAAERLTSLAFVAIATSDAVQLEASIQSMKQAMIADGTPEHNPRFDQALAHTLTDIFQQLTEYHPVARMRWFAEWMWQAFPAWKMQVPWLALNRHPITEMWQRRDHARLDTYLEHCWRVGGQSTVTIFDDSVDALTDALTGKQPNKDIPWHMRKFLPPSPIPSECLALRERIKHVPPAIMQACRPDGEKVVTAGAARFVRIWVAALSRKWRESLSNSQLHDYIKLACQHDSGHTIYNLLFTNLHPDCGASADIGARASILKTKRIRTHIMQVASTFGARKIMAYLEHWPELMEMYMKQGVYAHEKSEAYITRFHSLIGPWPDSGNDQDIPDPVARNTVHASSN